MFLPQIPAPPPGSIENWLLPAAAVASMAMLAKKLFGKKPTHGGEEFITCAELHQELTSVRDKIDARFLTLSEKIEHLGTSIHEKLTQLETSVARLDERTKS